jgi:hypothetical protein
MPTTYEPIATYTISGTSTATIAFNSIPQTYTDLVLVTNVKTTNNNNGNGWITFNSDTGTNYSQTRFYAFNNSLGTDKQTNGNYINLNQGGYNNGLLTYTSIMQYKNTNISKSVMVRINNIAQSVGINFACWRNNSAITRIDFSIHEGYINPNSTLTLYGIKGA